MRSLRTVDAEDTGDDRDELPGWRQRAALEHEAAALRIDRRGRAAFDGPRVDRGRTEQRVGRPRGERAPKLLEIKDGTTVIWSRAMPSGISAMIASWSDSRAW